MHSPELPRSQTDPVASAPQQERGWGLVRSTFSPTRKDRQSSPTRSDSFTRPASQTVTSRRPDVSSGREPFPSASPQHTGAKPYSTTGVGMAAMDQRQRGWSPPSAVQAAPSGSPGRSLPFFGSLNASHQDASHYDPQSMHNIANGLDGVEGMYRTMRQMEATKDAEIESLRSRVASLEAALLTAKGDVHRTFVEVAAEAQIADAEAFAARREKKRVLFTKWRWRLERRSMQRVLAHVETAANAAAAAAERYGDADVRHPRRIAAAVERLAAAETRVVAIRAAAASLLGGTEQAGVSWQGLLRDAAAAYDDVAKHRFDLLHIAVAHETETAKLATDATAALGMTAGAIEAAAQHHRGFKAGTALAATARRLLTGAGSLREPPAALSSLASLDIANDCVTCYVHWASASPLFTTLSNIRSDAPIPDGIPETLRSHFDALDGQLLTLPLTLRAREAVHRLEKHSAEEIAMSGGVNDDIRARNRRLAVELPLTTYVPDVGALLGNTTHGIQLPATIPTATVGSSAAEAVDTIREPSGISSRIGGHSPVPSLNASAAALRTPGTPAAALFSTPRGPQTPRYQQQSTSVLNTPMSAADRIRAIREQTTLR